MNERVSVVHNGIIENFAELKKGLIGKGHRFDTDTDTEVVVHLISDAMREGLAPVAATKRALDALQGAFALAIIFAGEDDLMIAARQGSPLAIGHGNGEMYLGSDAIALAPFTSEITYLEEGDWAVLTRQGATIHDRSGRIVERARTKSVATLVHGRQGQSPPFHGEGNPRAARGDQPHARPLRRSRRGTRGHA